LVGREERKIHFERPKLGRWDPSFPPAPAAFLVVLQFDPEDGGVMPLPNIELSPNNTAPQHRRQYSPRIILHVTYWIPNISLCTFTLAPNLFHPAGLSKCGIKKKIKLSL
jgi:hypothetical protein